MTVTLLQTADAIFYYPMLLETAKTVRAFCERNGYAYEQYVGIKRGFMPWQASFNRVYLLKEMLDRGVDGWVLYLDADAFIQDLDFDLSQYLEDRADSAAIFAGYSSCEKPYDINSGGFAINLSHPIGKAIVVDWYTACMNVPSVDFNSAVHWQQDVANDQYILFKILERYVEDLGIASMLMFERANQSYVNNGPFIGQFLRSMFPSFATRLAAVKAKVAEVIACYDSLSNDSEPGVYIRADHPKLFTASGRKTLSGIRSTGAEGNLVYGPYIPLPAGRYISRIYGEVRMRTDQEALILSSDVAIDQGFRILATEERRFVGPAKGIIMSLSFELAEPTYSLEVRTTAGLGNDVSVHAIQIVEA